MSSRCRVPVIGILGGIGSGKSSVVRQVDGFRFRIVDADRIGHEFLHDSQIKQALTDCFGQEIISETGDVNRSALAKRVFGDSDEQKADLQRLNQILHPAIRREIHSQIDSAPKDVDAVILDAALLLEGGWDATCNWLVFVDTPQHIREQRVMQNRGWSIEELAKREARQWSLQAKKDRADFVVDNSGTIAESAAQMKKVFTSILPAKQTDA